MFKHLSDHSLQFLLLLFTTSGIVIPVHKQRTIKSTFFVPTYLANQKCLRNNGEYGHQPADMVPRVLQSSAYHTIGIPQSQARDRQYHAATRHCWQIPGKQTSCPCIFQQYCQSIWYGLHWRLTFQATKNGHKRTNVSLYSVISHKLLFSSSSWLQAIHGQVPNKRHSPGEYLESNTIFHCY